VRLLKSALHFRRFAGLSGSAAADSLSTGTAIFRDGRITDTYRAVRFHPGRSTCCCPEGAAGHRVGDAGQLHFPLLLRGTRGSTSWSALPQLDTRLYQVETTSGTVATSSLARWAPRGSGKLSRPDRWVHGIQPAWSLDISGFLPRNGLSSQLAAARNAAQRLPADG
jgi:hypothetical protein